MQNNDPYLEMVHEKHALIYGRRHKLLKGLQQNEMPCLLNKTVHQQPE